MESREIELSYDILGLYPPMFIIVIMSVRMTLVDHRAIRAAALQGSPGYMIGMIEGLGNELRTAYDLGGLKEKP